MSDRKRLRRIVEFTCWEQGVPIHVEDPSTIRRVVNLIWPYVEDT